MRLLILRIRLRLQAFLRRSKDENSNRKLFIWAGRIATIPHAVVRAIGEFFGACFSFFASGHRSGWDLLAGIPAMIAMFLSVGLTAWGHYVQQSSQLDYWEQGELQIKNGDADTARLYLSKAMTVSSINYDEISFSLARAAEMQGDLTTARTLMSSLAPVGTAGLPGAHRFMAIALSESVPLNPDASFLEEWQWHLSHADQPSTSKMQKAWGYYYAVVGSLDRAAVFLRRAAESDPSLWLQVAELESKLQTWNKVEDSLQRAQKYFGDEFRRDPSNQRNRLLYSTSLFYSGALDEAGKLLMEGLKDDAENQAFRELLSAVIVRKYDRLASDGEISEELLSLLALSLEYSPSNEFALKRLIEVAQASNDNIDLAKKQVRRVLASGNATAMAHFVLGSLEWMDGKAELAKLSMRQAIALDPSLGQVANNMAYLIAHEDEPDLETALQFANQAISSDSNNPAYLDTRAEILFELGRLEDSAVDYLKALPNSAKKDEIRESLAKIYDSLGDPETAAGFREEIAPQNVPLD